LNLFVVMHHNGKWALTQNSLFRRNIKAIPSGEPVMKTPHLGKRSYHSSLWFLSLFLSVMLTQAASSLNFRKIENFNKNWKFILGDEPNFQDPGFDDSHWRSLNLPHDWSIEGTFSNDHPASPGGGALPGGIGWYRKTFTLPQSEKERVTCIDFDGVYRNSEVWINGHSLGRRPYGYSSFRYELTPYLKYGKEKNILAVKVDNSQQPNSRWYSGSGIYRNVRLVTTNKTFIDHWGTCVTTPEVTELSAKVLVKIKVRTTLSKNQSVIITTLIVDNNGKKVSSTDTKINLQKYSGSEIQQNFKVKNPVLWSIENPYMYKAITLVECNNKLSDTYETPFGIRTFLFDTTMGFLLNGKHVKINGVCNHHDLGCLGAAINQRALERQLEIMKSMGVNGIRTSHNPPAPELLDLCDRMGFIVMDEAFDMWKKGKTQFDYSLNWDEWHQRDIQDMVLRDRNHPCIFIWSIGNEVVEQWDKKDSSGTVITKELCSLIRVLDSSRPITSNCNSIDSLNPVIRADALDLIGYSYNQNSYEKFHTTYPGKKLIGSETVSSLNSRGCYDMPSDSIRRWPIRWDAPLTTGNTDWTCSSYDNCSAPWGSTHEETWKLMKKFNFISGQYIWTGFDYLGEPTPYPWPARSSYFGIVDLAGFPKDAYYLYQSEWTKKPVLHVFPHWNWKQGDTIDVWAYTNCEEVELLINGKSIGTKKKNADELHFVWRVPFTPGRLTAIGKTDGKELLKEEIKTAGQPSRIVLEADRTSIAADGTDLSFVTVKVQDEQGTLVPRADNLIHFEISGDGKIIGVDNGLQTDHDSFLSHERKAFNGLCLAVLQSNEKEGTMTLNATSGNLKQATIVIESKKKIRY
jgi:beta-galactosidase